MVLDALIDYTTCSAELQCGDFYAPTNECDDEYDIVEADCLCP